jgi:hypothetical protein
VRKVTPRRDRALAMRRKKSSACRPPIPRDRQGDYRASLRASDSCQTKPSNLEYRYERRHSHPRLRRVFYDLLAGREGSQLSGTATCRHILCPTISGLRGSRHGARCSSLLRLPVGHMPASDTPASCSQHRVPLPNIMACHRPHRCALHAASSMRTNCSDREQECDQQFLEIHAFYPKGCHSNESAPLHIAVKPALAHPGFPKHHQDRHERGADKQA